MRPSIGRRGSRNEKRVGGLNEKMYLKYIKAWAFSLSFFIHYICLL